MYDEENIERKKFVRFSIAWLVVTAIIVWIVW